MPDLHPSLPNYAAWLTTESLAVQTGVSSIVVTNWIVSGIKTDTRRIRLRATKVGGRWKIDPAAVTEFFAATTKASLPASASIAPDVPIVEASPTEADIRRRGEACMARLKARGLLNEPTSRRRS